jgi:hypothetical protein
MGRLRSLAADDYSAALFMAGFVGFVLGFVVGTFLFLGYYHHHAIH